MPENSVWAVFDLTIVVGGTEPGAGFPDIEAVVSGYLKGATDAGNRVYTRIPASPQYPLITVSRLGGIPTVKHHQDAAQIQVSVWGNTKAEARDIATDARLALMTLEGATADDAFVHGVDDATGLTWLPDSETGRDRYLFGVFIYFR